MAKNRKSKMDVYRQHQEPITKEKLIKLFPQKKSTINQKTVDLINSSIEDPQFDGYSFENTLVEFKTVMDRRKGSIHDYIRAIKFVSYLEGGMNATEAYKMAFSDRDLVRNAIGKATTSNAYMMVVSSATRYRRSPMVQDILTLADIQLSLIHTHTVNDAIGVLVDEMYNAPHSKERIAAAATIVKELKAPEKQKYEMEIGLNQDAHEQIQSTNDRLALIAENQAKMISQGMNINDVQEIHIKKNDDIVEAELDE